jgi:aspartate aminotransferase-like enzyme
VPDSEQLYGRCKPGMSPVYVSEPALTRIQATSPAYTFRTAVLDLTHTSPSYKKPTSYTIPACTIEGPEDGRM